MRKMAIEYFQHKKMICWFILYIMYFFNAIRYRKLNSFLEGCSVTRELTSKFNYSEIKQYQTYLSLNTKEGVDNCNRLADMLYEKQPACVRIKILILIHYLILSNQDYDIFFLNKSRKKFEGVHIKKKQTLDTCQNVSNNNSSMVSKRCATRRSIDDEIDYTDVEVYLHMSLVMPYYTYVMKLCAGYDFYQETKKDQNIKLQNYDFNVVWRIVNILKSFSLMREVLTHIGRYYLKDSQYVISLIEAITSDINIYYFRLQKHLMKCKESHQTMKEPENKQFLILIGEVNQINEFLFDIYFNRYFAKATKHIQPPKWCIIESTELEFIYEYSTLKFGYPNQKSKKVRKIKSIKNVQESKENSESALLKYFQQSYYKFSKQL